VIDALLPDTVVGVEALHEESDPSELFAEEAELVAVAVPKRRAEFTTVRACARRAMTKLGVEPAPVLPGPRGEPRWPAGVVGSMTHCDGYRAAVLGRSADVRGIGIDAERHAQVPWDIIEAVALPSELRRIQAAAGALPEVHWDRLLFSAKESVYKTWFPLTGQRLEFEDADIAFRTDAGRRDTGAFRAWLLRTGRAFDGAVLTGFDGRWLARGGFVCTAIVLPATS
jgi:4'-phosphopantetheinyl transferase EntD